MMICQMQLHICGALWSSKKSENYPKISKLQKSHTYTTKDKIWIELKKSEPSAKSMVHNQRRNNTMFNLGCHLAVILNAYTLCMYIKYVPMNSEILKTHGQHHQLFAIIKQYFWAHFKIA